MELFDMIKCSSETEEVAKNILTRLPLTWCSPEFSTLARQLDKIHIHKTIITKRLQHVQAFTLEHIQQSSTSPPQPTDYTYVPQSLPLNCYSNEYYGPLSAINKQLLNPGPIVDFTKLLSIAKHLCKSSDLIYLVHYHVTH
jgi:hypothetical protein